MSKSENSSTDGARKTAQIIVQHFQHTWVSEITELARAYLELTSQNAKLRGTLEEIGSDMYVGHKKACGCGDAANKMLKEINGNNNQTT